MDEEELRRWFEHVHHTLETAYAAHEEPWRQSGMSGPEERWERLRRPVADAIDRSGAFLDIGCANGYLLECVLKWTAERGISVDPYGMDVSARLVEMAKQRLPAYDGHFFVGNAFYWTPPRRFDYVRTELVYVPAEYERDFVLHLMEDYLSPGGSLLVANYGEGLPDPERGILPGSHPTRYLLDRLSELGFSPQDVKDGYDPVKDRHVRVCVLKKEEKEEPQIKRG